MRIQAKREIYWRIGRMNVNISNLQRRRGCTKRKLPAI